MYTILISDDDAATRAVIEGSLIRNGYSVIISSNGQRSWEILQDNPHIDLIISDVIMPGLDGRELVNLIRSDEQLCDLPIVMISGIVSLQEIHQLLIHGASRFIPKPISQIELLKTIDLLLGNRLRTNPAEIVFEQ